MGPGAKRCLIYNVNSSPSEARLLAQRRATCSATHVTCSRRSRRVLHPLPLGWPDDQRKLESAGDPICMGTRAAEDCRADVRRRFSNGRSELHDGRASQSSRTSSHAWTAPAAATSAAKAATMESFPDSKERSGLERLRRCFAKRKQPKGAPAREGFSALEA